MQILDNFGCQNGGIRQIGRIAQIVIPQPEDVEIGLIAFDQVFVGVASETLRFTSLVSILRVVAADRVVQVGSREEYLTPAECATRLKLHVGTVRRLIRDGVLPGKKLGQGRWRIPENVLDAFMTGGAQSDANSVARPPESPQVCPHPKIPSSAHSEKARRSCGL